MEHGYSLCLAELGVYMGVDNTTKLGDAGWVAGAGLVLD